MPFAHSKMKNNRIYDFEIPSKWVYTGKWWTGYKRVYEAPLPYTPMNIEHTPQFFQNFLSNNAKFGASYQGCPSRTCQWQHYFMNGTHYKVCQYML